MNRNYPRVEKGVGAFHNPPRAKYSEETRNLIKILMEESKVSMLQRKSIQNALDRGDPLPRPIERTKYDKNKGDEPQIMYPNMWKKRSQDLIVNSGAYEREQYRRTAPLPNKEKEKRHLACMMAFGKDVPETARGPKLLHKARKESQIPEDLDPVQDLIDGIRERMEFLNDMECLGMGKKYQSMIHQEIAHKLRVLESIDRQKSIELGNEVQLFKYQRPAKPFPLGDLDDN